MKIQLGVISLFLQLFFLKNCNLSAQNKKDLTPFYFNGDLRFKYDTNFFSRTEISKGILGQNVLKLTADKKEKWEVVVYNGYSYKIGVIPYYEPIFPFIQIWKKKLEFDYREINFISIDSVCNEFGKIGVVKFYLDSSYYIRAYFVSSDHKKTYKLIAKVKRNLNEKYFNERVYEILNSIYFKQP